MPNQLDIYRFSSMIHQLGLVHGVFGRAGGLSQAPFDSLNVGKDVGDSQENIQGNLGRICDALGLEPRHLVTARQVHGNQVARVRLADLGRVVGRRDGLVTDEPRVPLIMRFADCVPLMFYDAQRGVVGLAHAGWRGTVAKVAQVMVRTLREQYGCRPADLTVGIGPAIGACCYEVGHDLIAQVKDVFGDKTGQLIRTSDGRLPHLDLWQANRLLLEEAGVGEIETAGVCTGCHRERFFSHRGDGGRTGRFAMVAVLT